ncbi:unnamed protein product [Candidula unifasciata]|uniref:MACPF domain-containing protein n=1 Tax=Candidula unifasciata TaxID=100452 RepID=A0A8S3Z516_9EUPU|nr:unnamed protein product [Candidula unifasciata]
MKHALLPVIAVAMCFLVSDHHTVRAECTNPPPGVSRMIRGVDITKLDIVPLQILGSNGFKSPVLNFTCSGGRRWRNPRGIEYQLPDQVWQMTSIPGGWVSADVSLYKTYEDVRRSMNSEVGIRGSLWKFSFSASRNYMKLQNTISNSSRYVSDIAAFESATRVDFIPSWVIELDRFAAAYIDRRISGTFESNPAAYNRFIENFGTHYFSTANFGGYIRVTFETSSSYFYSRTDSEVKSKAKASFLKIISAHGGRVTGSTTEDSTFVQQSTQSIRYFGGVTNLLAHGGMSQWQPTVDNDPWLFSGELHPISDLITDDTKRTSMERAVSNYVVRSYLNELERLVVTAKSKLNNPVLDSLLTRITAQKVKPALVENEVEVLGRDVNEQIVVPDWFRSNTQLCYKWRADGDGGQCGGGAANLLCVRPNLMTPVYRDDTDRRGGGCRMQWGIQSQGFPSWFNQVRVCYRWYPDGDGGQCGGGAARELCSNINEYSPEYRDDTDNRGGGCRMSWRIEVPDSAPLWMKTSKMCFSWYPDGDGGQCSGPSRDLCTTANQWTEYYRDDTDNRGGGCRMSWGIRVDL